MPAQTVIKLRRDTAANWDTINPVLAAGEMGVETDTGLHKIGDGSNTWGALQYAASSKIVTQVKNTTGSSIPKGSVVYISGATGGDALISLADADLEMTSSKTLGFTSAAIANDGYGTVIEQGLLAGVDTSTATAGQAVYLSTTSGGYVFGAAPAKPAHSVYLGVVVRVHATEGEILVKVQNGYELNELHDVDAGSPTPGEFLQWDGSAWVNAAVDIPPGTVISESAPLTPDSGQLWWNSTTGTLYIYYDATWVEVAAGTVGPQGPEGPEGPAGPTGPSGVPEPIAVSSNITMVALKRYFVDTSAARTLTLPASPVLGDEIQVFDSTGTAGTNVITIANNSQKINGVLDSALLDANGVAASFVYTGSTYGWRMG